MLKPLAVFAALTCCALGTAQAVLLTKDSVLLVNFNAAPRDTSTATQVFMGGVGAASSDAVMMDFYDGKDLTGARLGSYSNQDSGWKTLSGLLDGEFSVRFTVTSATASVGDDNGDLNTVWLTQDGPPLLRHFNAGRRREPIHPRITAKRRARARQPAAGFTGRPGADGHARPQGAGGLSR